MENKEMVFVVVLAEMGIGPMETHLHGSLEGARARVQALIEKHCADAWEWDELDMGGDSIQSWRCGCDYIEIFEKEIGA